MGIGIVLAGIGAALLVYGSQLFVESASTMAETLGVSKLIIGLTIVSMGTSAPELTTSIVASLRGETDLAIGNAVGASVINLLGVIGLSALFSGGGLEVPEAALQLDFPVAITVGIIVLAIAVFGRRAGRRDGILMIGFYAIYLGTLIAISQNDDLLSPASIIALAVVLPVTIAIAVFAIVRSILRPGIRRLDVPFVDR